MHDFTLCQTLFIFLFSFHWIQASVIYEVFLLLKCHILRFIISYGNYSTMSLSLIKQEKKTFFFSFFFSSQWFIKNKMTLKINIVIGTSRRKTCPSRIWSSQRHVRFGNTYLFINRIKKGRQLPNQWLST